MARTIVACSFSKGSTGAGVRLLARLFLQRGTRANKIEIPWYESVPVHSRGLIIHECTHAAMDIRMASLNTEVEEGIAYISQALYLLERGEPIVYYQPSPHELIRMIGWKIIFDQAANIANLIHNGTDPVPESQAQILFFGIRNANFYRDRLNDPSGNDGIGDAFYQKEMEMDMSP
jgi:hypothetical protein